MITKKITSALILSLSLIGFIAHSESFPSRNLEFIAGYGPGGGHDTMLRTMAKIIKSNKLSSANINVVNKPGGSGATSLGYLNSHQKDGHYLMAATSSFITTPLISDIDLNYKDFTPIARLGIDPVILVLPVGSKFKSIKDIKSAGKKLNVAGGSTGGIEHIATMMLEDDLSADFNFIPYQGDGEVVSALLSRQVDFALLNPGAVASFIKSNRLKALAISTTERTELFPNIPTFVEQGYNVNISVFRGVVAAKGISEKDKNYLSDLMKKLTETKEWKDKYLIPNSIVPAYLDSDDFNAYLNEMNSTYQTMLTRLKIIK